MKYLKTFDSDSNQDYVVFNIILLGIMYQYIIQ